MFEIKPSKVFFKRILRRRNLLKFLRQTDVLRGLQPRIKAMILRNSRTYRPAVTDAFSALPPRRGEGRRGADRRRRVRKVGSISVWSAMLNDPSIEDINSVSGQNFRRRFRIPFTVFKDYLVPQFRQHNLFNIRRQFIPLEIKILVGLRMLARGLTADDIPELTGIGASTAQAIFKQFCQVMCNHFSSAFLPDPTLENIRDAEEVYRKLGFPGCIGSIDCTHFEWKKCPQYLQNLCTGKEGYPTLAFQTVVDHGRRIRWLSPAFYGSTNDKGICHEDSFINRIRNSEFSQMEFELYNANDETVRYRGAYFICDGGYPEEASFQPPLTNSWDRDTVLYSEWIESVRKDVECTFGILKQRFRYLTRGIELHNIADINHVVRTCCILHNIM